MSKKLMVQETGKWKKKEKAENRRRMERERVRETYANKKEVEVIPATVDIDSIDHPITMVAAYCRVSTLEDAQAGSFERQIQHFREMIENTEGWKNVVIYADEGVSGTNMKKRPEFQRMIQDCKDGKIDLIVTKSVSRFARNTRDCLEVVRVLKGLSPPVGVFFEDVNLNTIEAKNEFTLGVMSLVAQGESEAKSAAITWSVIERFKNGVPIISTNNLLGYDKDKFGKLIVVEEEAEVVRYIYNCYLDGQTVKQIAEALTEAHIPTVKGREVWNSGTVRNILKNEKYCGDVIMQKTFTVDCFSHKTVINRGQKPKYRLTDDHEAIVSRKVWDKVQELLKEPRRYGNGKKKPIEKKFRVSKIKNGRLKGFAVIDPRWRQKDVDKFFEWLSKSEERKE